MLFKVAVNQFTENLCFHLCQWLSLVHLVHSSENLRCEKGKSLLSKECILRQLASKLC